MDELEELWADDRLVEALARRQPLGGADDDRVAGPLLALAQLADRPAVPGYDVHRAAADAHRNRRYAVRSLAIAVTAVATLSTTGVAAVVTGDPFRPATAVWQQIKEHASAGEQDRTAGSGDLLGAVRRAGDGAPGREYAAEPGRFSPGRDGIRMPAAVEGTDRRDARAGEEGPGGLAGASAAADAVGDDGDPRSTSREDTSGTRPAGEESPERRDGVAADDEQDSTAPSEEERRARQDDRRTEESDRTAEEDAPEGDDGPTGDQPPDAASDDPSDDPSDSPEDPDNDPENEPDVSDDAPVDPPVLTRSAPSDRTVPTPTPQHRPTPLSDTADTATDDAAAGGTATPDAATGDAATGDAATGDAAQALPTPAPTVSPTETEAGTAGR